MVTSHTASRGFKVLIAFVIITLKLNTVLAVDCQQALEGLTPEAELGKDLKMFYQIQVAAPDSNAAILTEKHSLKDLVLQDPKKNLAVRAPFVVMNAAQRMLALIYSQGKSKIQHKLTGDEIDFYPFFSSGTAGTKGFRIIGNEKALAEFVDNIKAQAAGDRSGSSVVLLVANAGTGKSETLKILSVAAETLTSQVSSKYASYTYSWKNLGEIDALHRFVPTTEVGGKRVFVEIDAPLGDSPFVLLPKEYQDILVNATKTEVEKLTDGMTASPFRIPDPWSQFIRDTIIQHYSAREGRALNSQEILEILNKHIVVKRQILGQTYGKMPLIDAQGNDIDVGGLFMQPNATIRYLVGPNHPMAWHFNGKFFQGHGNMTLWEEFYRNPKELRDMVLSAFESRRLSVGGAPTVPFDSVMIAVTNTASLKEAQAEGKTKGKDGQGVSTASVDRFRKTPMRWSVDPAEIAKLMLYSKSENLNQEKLGSERSEVTKGNLDELLPRSVRLEKIQTPDGRYKIYFGEGSRRVELAPHTLMLMSEIIAATRMETSSAKAKEVFNGKITDSHLFRSPIERIRLLEGLKPEAQPDELKELAEVMDILEEGEGGMSSRDAMKWFTASIEAARNEKTGYTLTPGVLLKKFRSMLNEGSIVTPSHKARMEWMELSKDVVNQLLIPRLDGDISRALANGDQVVQKAYFEILDEMFAIHLNPDASTYTSSSTGQEHGIDRGRLSQIKDLYLKRNGRGLNIDQIAIFHSRQRMVGQMERVPEESLLEVIAQYYASLHTQVAGFTSLVEFERTGNGTDEVRSAHASLLSALNTMGYNKVAIHDALMLINDHRSRSQAAQ